MTDTSLPPTALATTAIQAVTYSAKSTLDPKGSLATQQADARALADAEGYVVVADYADEAHSGFSADRGPGLEYALTHCERLAKDHGQAVLIVQHSDRLARGDGRTAKHVVEYALWAMKREIVIRSVQDDQTFRDLLYAVVTGQRNHEDSARKAAAVKSGMARRRKLGLHVGGPPKYGYDYVLDEFGRSAPVPKMLNEQEAAIIKRVFTESAAGMSQKQIVRRLNRDGIKAKRGGTWTQGTLAKLLADIQYAGFMRDGDDLISAQAPAIISLDLFRQVEALRTAARKSQGGPRGRMTRGNHLLVNGHLRCGRCGGSMIPRSGSQKLSPTGKPWGQRYERYLCSTHLADPTACPQMPIKRAVIDDALVGYLLAVAIDFESTKQQYMEIVGQRAEETQQLLDHAERELAQANARLSRVRRDYQDGNLDADDWNEQRTELGAELEAAVALRDRLLGQSSPQPSLGSQEAEDAVLRRFSELRRVVAGEIASAEDVQALRAILTKLFERFEFVADRVSQAQAELLEGGTNLNTSLGYLRPVPRPDMVELGLHRWGWTPLQQPLPAPPNNDAMRLSLESLFGAIPIVDER